MSHYITAEAAVGIQCSDFVGVERIDAATLPPFSNASRCPICGNGRELRVHYSPGSATIAGPHFRRICSGCGARWDERATSAEALPSVPLPSASG